MNTVEFDPQREVRFALVMYGGVSLAIYINGVAQELLNLVRATAPAAVGSEEPLLGEGNEELNGSAGVYRKLGQYLRSGDEDLAWVTKTGPDHNPIQTRFIVDVISGTSAGGINGVFLAKALARNQTMNGLKTLWLTEGDLGKLLNDTKAEDYSRDLGFAVQKPEASLLNSQRMYRKLLEALKKMGESGGSGGDSPLVSELDLFVTTTDIEGIPLPIKLADGVVYERRYRNVFHFRYATEKATGNERDDFKKENDPFLAFAARCTSSFPFAFEAMQLGDIKTILDRFHDYEGDDPTENDNPKERDRWDDFFRDYLRLGLFDINKKARGEELTGLLSTTVEATDKLREAFRSRSFGDGGYLDNKPFSYATSMLMRRHSDCVVDRKLLYVEPTPDHPELAPRKPEPRPDFAKNVRAAVLDLPTQETIREDIERIDERNAILERIASSAKYVDEDASLIGVPQSLNRTQFVAADLHEMVQRYGPSYGTYHRLKVHEITELLTCLVTRALGHNPASDAGDAIRELVATWRNDKYKLIKPLGTRANGQARKTENEFLIDYDIHYRLRRLSFLSRRINQLAGLGERDQPGSTAKSLLLAWLDRACKIDVPRSSARSRIATPTVNPDKLGALRDWLNANENKSAVSTTDQIPDPDEWLKDFRHELNAIKRDELAKPTQKARFTEEQFLNPESTASGSLREKIAQLKLPWGQIEPILSENYEIKQRAIAQFVESGVMANLDSVADTLRDIFDNRSSSGVTIAGPNHTDPTKGRDAARLCLEHYYQNFLLYDLITYPIQYGTGAGEANVVQVYRVSPEDAPAIMEESAGQPRDKLAGRTLMSFGAFLDERWRRNDMLWGRLDGAERLICTLLPLPDKIEKTDPETNGHKALREKIERKRERRSNLIYEAHLGILREEFQNGNADAICRLLSNALVHPHKCSSDNEHVKKLSKALQDENPGMTDVQRNYLQVPQALDRHLDPETALKYISRSTNITGNMLEGLADKHEFDRGKRVSASIARFGATFWNMIAVAVPQSLGNLFFRHWLRLGYLFAFALIIVGIFVNNNVKFAGWEVLGIIAVVHLIVSGLTSYMRGKRFLKLAKAVAIFVLLSLIAIGVLHLIERWRQISLSQLNELGVAAAIASVGTLLLSIPQRRAQS